MSGYGSAGVPMGTDALSSTVTDDCDLYHEIPGGGYYDPSFSTGSPAGTPPPPPLTEDPSVLAALQNVQNAIDNAGGTIPGGLSDTHAFGIPWPWVAAGLVAILILRR